MHERLTKRAVKILTTMCRKALCSLFPLGLPPDLLLSTVAQLPNITQAVLYCCVTVSMSGNWIDEQLCDSREESAMTPTVQGETLVYRQDGQDLLLPVLPIDQGLALDGGSHGRLLSAVAQLLIDAVTGHAHGDTTV